MDAPLIYREQSRVAILHDPQNDTPLGEADIRLEDYLNDKIQTRADLASLASLMQNIELQKKQLEDQLEDARAKLEHSKQASANHNTLIFQRAKEFEQHQSNAYRRLMIVTSSDTPEEAVERLKGPMKKLRQVDLAREYVELLAEVDNLTKDARKHLPGNPKEALRPYTQLKELASSLRSLQEPAEGAAVHLVNYVDQTSTRLWEQMKKIMTEEFESILQKSKWPDAATEPTREWSDCFEKLLDLQYPELLEAKEPTILLPMSVLTKTFTQQFRYHFFSDKPTNAPNKLGDYFLPWFTGTIDNWEPFLREGVGPVLAAHFRGSELAGNSIYIDPVAAFITALLPVLQDKVGSLLKEISNDPGLLSRFMYQLFEFDETVRTRFNYDAGNVQFGWKGITWEVLDTYFDRWLQVEKDFALTRYQEIIKAPDSIDYDSATQGKTKYTSVVAQVTDLLVTVTKSYNHIRRFRNKMYFLIEIQAEILDQYHGRLSDSLDAYQTIMSPLGRRLHGVSKEMIAEVEGVAGIESLCKVYGSADHIIATLNEWSNDEFFVIMWEELQQRAKTTSVDDNLAGQMTYAVVKESTSTAVGSDGEGSVFDTTIEGFSRLQNRALDFLMQAPKSSFPQIFRQYLSTPQWTTVGDEIPNSHALAITPELDLPLQKLREELAFVQRTLAYAPCRRIWRTTFDSLQDLLWNDVLFKQSFTALGAARLMQDILALERVVDAPTLGMPKLKEGAHLLNLPVHVEDGQPGPSLMEACSEISENESRAEVFMAKLEYRYISRHDARGILRRRVETFDWGVL